MNLFSIFFDDSERNDPDQICDAGHHQQIWEKSHEVHHCTSLSSTGNSSAPMAEAATAQMMTAKPDETAEKTGM